MCDSDDLLRLLLFKRRNILSGVLSIQITAPFYPGVESASQIADMFKALRLQVIRNHERVPATRTYHDNLLLPGELMQVLFEPERIHFVRIGQTFPLPPLAGRAYIQDESLVIEQDGLVELRG